MDDTAMKKAKTEAADYIESNQEIFVDISHQIWQYAELSLKEYRSAELYCKILKENGFTVKENICGIATAFTGHYGSGKPVIGILAEFDALGGVGALLLRKSPEDRQHKFAVSHARHVRGQKLRFNAERFQLADAFE